MTIKLTPLGLWLCFLPRSLMASVIETHEHEDGELDILEPAEYYDETVGQPQISVTNADDQDDFSEITDLPGAAKDEDDEIFNDEVSSTVTGKLEHGLEFEEANLTSLQAEVVVTSPTNEHEDEELEQILKPEEYEEIANSLPDVYYDETVGQPEISITPADDFSEISDLPGASKDEDNEFFNDDNGVSSTVTLTSDKTSLSTPQAEAVVTSPTGTLASSFSYFTLSEASTSGLTRLTVAGAGIPRSKSDSGSSDTVPLALPKKRRRASLAEENPWKEYMSHAIKEEIRCKIQLKRINMGEEELKVEYEKPETTISYDAVQRRNEVRERNKQYAKLSRQRVKDWRQQLVEKHSSLIKERDELRHDIARLKSRISDIDGSLKEHQSYCDLAEQTSSNEDSDDE